MRRFFVVFKNVSSNKQAVPFPNTSDFISDMSGSVTRKLPSRCSLHTNEDDTTKSAADGSLSGISTDKEINKGFHTSHTAFKSLPKLFFKMADEIVLFENGRKKVYVRREHNRESYVNEFDQETHPSTVIFFNSQSWSCYDANNIKSPVQCCNENVSDNLAMNISTAGYEFNLAEFFLRVRRVSVEQGQKQIYI